MMGTPLQEQLNNQHPQADRDCEGCHGSAWLTALVDSTSLLEEAGQAAPIDFAMKCDECDVLHSDNEAIVAARKAGMIVDDYGVVTYTKSQLEFIG